MEKNEKIIECRFKPQKKDPRILYLVLVAVLLLLVLTILWIDTAYGVAVDGSDVLITKEIQRIGTSNSHKIVIEFCKNASNSDYVGILIRSDLEKVPVFLDKQALVGKCQVHVSKIFASNPSTIKASLFEKEDVAGLASEFNAKIASLEEKKVKAHQELRKIKMSSYYDEKKIERIEKSIEQNNKLQKSAKYGLSTLYSLRK